jgi:hypothetical protein
LSNCRQGSGTWSIKSPNFYGGSDIPWSGQSTTRGGRANSMKNLCAGDLETWGGGLPNGFAKRNTPTVDQEASIVLLSSSSAKITYPSSTGFQGIEFTLPANSIKGFTSEAVTIRNADYAWTASAVAGEYYLTLAGGGNPSVPNPHTVIINGTPRQVDTIGVLGENRWAYGDNDALGYSTIYVDITPVGGAGDPDDEAIGFIKYVDYQTYITVSAYCYSPATNKASARLWASNYEYGSGSLSNQDSGANGTFTLPSDSWQKCITTFEVSPYVTNIKFGIGMYNETAGDLLYVDGIEIMTGRVVSDRYNDNTW